MANTANRARIDDGGRPWPALWPLNAAPGDRLRETCSFRPRTSTPPIYYFAGKAASRGPAACTMGPWPLQQWAMMLSRRHISPVWPGLRTEGL